MVLCPPASICSGPLCFSHLSLFSFRAVQYAAFHSRHSPAQPWGCRHCPCHLWSNMGERNYLLIFFPVEGCLWKSFLNQVRYAYISRGKNLDPAVPGASCSPTSPSQVHQLWALLVRQRKKECTSEVERMNQKWCFPI